MLIGRFFFYTTVLFIIFTGRSYSQNLKKSFVREPAKNPGLIESNSSLSALGITTFLFPLNPILLIENKKFYAGITKEISAGIFPYGRIACEYSLIFRETHLNQLRFSYNYDFPIETGDFAAVMITAGGGYFTDFSKEGFFPQMSLNALIAADDHIGIDPYVKFRYTVMTDSNESNIFDLSFGLASIIYF